MSGVFRSVSVTARLWATLPPLTASIEPPCATVAVEGSSANSVMVTVAEVGVADAEVPRPPPPLSSRLVDTTAVTANPQVSASAARVPKMSGQVDESPLAAAPGGGGGKSVGGGKRG